MFSDIFILNTTLRKKVKGKYSSKKPQTIFYWDSMTSKKESPVLEHRTNVRFAVLTVLFKKYV